MCRLLYGILRLFEQRSSKKLLGLGETGTRRRAANDPRGAR
jgi:hypothetical protein